MVRRLLFAFCIVVPVAAAQGAEPALVPYAVTIEGNASIEVTADTCNAAFVIGERSMTPEGALEKLAGARKSFETAVRKVIGGNGRMEFGPPAVSRHMQEGRAPFTARQTATAVFTSFPSNSEDFSAYLAKIITEVAGAGVMAEGAAGPAVTFEVTRPQVLEERLASAAFEDAQKRASRTSKLLKRGLGLVLSAHFPAGVAVGGEYLPFSNLPNPVVSDEMKTVITYTVLVAYELEV